MTCLKCKLYREIDALTSSPEAYAEEWIRHYINEHMKVRPDLPFTIAE